MLPAATVWLLDAGIGVETEAVFRSWLSATEERRYQSFTRLLRRRQYIAGRGLLRLALAAELGVAPSSIVLAERPGQAPLLAMPADGGAGFSVSHSGNWVACAVSLGTAIGLDIEVRDAARDVASIGEYAFSEQQCDAIAALPLGERLHAFYRTWTELEARIKLNAACTDGYQFDHPCLAVTLCSAQRLGAAPRLCEARIETHSGMPVLTSRTGEGTTGRPAR